MKLPTLKNPAAPKKVVVAADEAEDVLDAVTKDSNDDDDEIDETDDPDEDDEDQDEDEDEEIEDKPTKPAKVVAKKTGSNLSAQQEQVIKEIEALGKDQGKGVSSLINLAERMVSIGHYGTFDVTQVKSLYMRFRAASNSAAGKNKEFNDGENDNTILANTSKLKTFYKLGVEKGVDGWGKMLAVARDIHVSILRDKDQRKLLRNKGLIPTYEALVSVARQQLSTEKDAKGIAHPKFPSLMTEEQIRNVFIDENKVEEEPTVKDVIDAAAKAIERVLNGKIDPVSGTYKREAFAVPDGDEDDGSVGRSLKWSLDYMLMSGERYQRGYIANREKEKREAEEAAAERKRKHNERVAREEEERLAKKAARAEKQKETARQKALEAEAKKQVAAQ